MEVVICLLLLLGAPTEAEVDQAIHEILSDAAYQTALPARTVPTTPEEPSDRLGSRDGGFGRGLDGPPGAFAVIARLVWWILVAVGAATLLLWLARELGARYDRAPRPVAAPGVAVRPAPAVRADPDALAGAGRYGEAIHALLLQVLAELRNRSEVPPAWTSREVAAHVPLAGEAREGLRSLVHSVERTHFGGVPADAGEYRRRADDAKALLSELPRGARG
jgi:hypothetical protein